MSYSIKWFTTLKLLHTSKGLYCCSLGQACINEYLISRCLGHLANKWSWIIAPVAFISLCHCHCSMIDAFFAPLSRKAAPQSFVVIKCRLRRLLADYLSASITEIVMCVNLRLPDRLSDAKAIGVIINIQPNWKFCDFCFSGLSIIYETNEKQSQQIA